MTKNKTSYSDLFFSRTRDFLDLYMVKQASKSRNTVEAYRSSLSTFRRYVTEVRKISIKSFTFDQCDYDFVLSYSVTRQIILQ